MGGFLALLDPLLSRPTLLVEVDDLRDSSRFVVLTNAEDEELKRLLLRESQVQPLVVVFEDLHWIDGETQAALDGLVESLPTARVLLLVNYRPEYHHGWGSKTYYRQLRMDALPVASAAELLQALLGNDPSLDPLARLLVERTERNPLFLEESVRTLVETRVLVGAPGAYRLARVPASLERGGGWRRAHPGTAPVLDPTNSACFCAPRCSSRPGRWCTSWRSARLPDSRPQPRCPCD